MIVRAQNIGRRFNREWVFRRLDAEFLPDSKTVILGGNGSGKSTCIQLISGFLSPTEGEIQYTHEGKAISFDSLFRLVALTSPYSSVPEDFTLMELVEFQMKLKPFQKGMTSADVVNELGLSAHASKLIRNYSSGMKQRVKLGLSILSQSPLLLLDEPTSNLDSEGIGWFSNLIERHSRGKTVLICSNHKEAEMKLCDSQLNIGDFKAS